MGKQTPAFHMFGHGEYVVAKTKKIPNIMWRVTSLSVCGRCCPGDGWCLPNSSALLVIPFGDKHTVAISYHICKITNMAICVHFLIHRTYHLMGVDMIPWLEWLCKPVYLSTCLTHWAKHTVQSKQPWMVASRSPETVSKSNWLWQADKLAGAARWYILVKVKVKGSSCWRY